jgi:quercetin dioxygenase-like cupin family protein
MERVHADRREPATPEGVVDLEVIVDELLSTAAEQSAGRAARTLTPGSGSRLKQTLLAIVDGRQLDDHVAPGQATLQVLRGSMLLAWDDHELRLQTGDWATIPSELHRVVAEADSAALITTVTDS